MNLVEVAEEIQHRIIHIFGRDIDGKRATNGGNPTLDQDPHFRDYVWFYEVMCCYCCWSSTRVDFGKSSFTLTMDAVLVLLIRPVGPVSLPSTSYKAEPVVGFLEHPRVSSNQAC
jgi:hypothetical protein